MLHVWVKSCPVLCQLGLPGDFQCLHLCKFGLVTLVSTGQASRRRGSGMGRCSHCPGAVPPLQELASVALPAWGVLDSLGD